MNPLQKNIILAPLNLLYSISPKAALKILFRIRNGYRLNFKEPRTYNEKLQWLKVYYKNPILPKLVDKYSVREYVRQRAPELLTKLYWEGFEAGAIPWDSLPDKFVIKVTHGSGFNIICTDKAKIDRIETERTLTRWLKAKFLKCYGEWFYGVVRPRIIIEEFLDNGSGQTPEDYKILCFDGKAKVIIVDTGRYICHKRNVYDLDWHFLENVTMDFENDVPLKKPQRLDELIRYAELLSYGFPQVRVDLYDVGGSIYFGELTFTNGAGFDKIRPIEFDYEMGSWFRLPDPGVADEDLYHHQ